MPQFPLESDSEATRCSDGNPGPPREFIKLHTATYAAAAGASRR